MTEESFKHRKLAIMTLAKALDDICPTYDIETPETKKVKIKERIEFFAKSEQELDQEWELLKKTASEELQLFKAEREEVFAKIAATDNSERVKVKVLAFERKKQERVDYLVRKLERDVATIQMKMELFRPGTKKHAQLSNRVEVVHNQAMDKIRKTEHRYNTIIKNTMNSDNSERVAKRLELSKSVWTRKYNELIAKYEAQEEIFQNKSMIYDQIRIAIAGFEDHLDYFKHWCIMADVPVKICYEEAIRRAKKVDRDTSGMEEVLKRVLQEGV